MFDIVPIVPLMDSHSVRIQERHHLVSRLTRPVLLLVLAAALAMAPAIVSAAPSSGKVTGVSLLSADWVPVDGDIAVGVRLTVDGDVPPLTVDLELSEASGRVRWRTSQRRSDLRSITTQLSFARPVEEIGLEPGVYTLRAQVSSGGEKRAERRAQVIVMDPMRPPVPVSVIVRLSGLPETLPDGGAADATSTVRARTDAADLGRLAVVRPDLHLTAAIAPYLLDAWVSASRRGPAVDSTATDLAGEALEALRGATAAGMPLLRSMYGDPDLSLLRGDKAGAREQLTAGELALSTALPDSRECTGFGLTDGLLPRDAAGVLAAAGIQWAVVDTACVLPDGSGSALPIPYKGRLTDSDRDHGARIGLLVVDRPGSQLLSDPRGADRLAARLHDRSGSRQAGQPVVLELAVGESGLRIEDVEKAVAALSLLPWVELKDVPAVATSPAPQARLAKDPRNGEPAPAAFQRALKEARLRVRAFAAAAGEDDVDVIRARGSILLAEARVWAERDGSWGLVDRASAYVSAGGSLAREVLADVRMDAVSVTLPGSEGKVPVSISNGSDRGLTVRLSAASTDMRVFDSPVTARLRPGENVIYVPVALGTSTSGDLHLSLSAGDLELDRATTRVQASYLDRIVLLAAAFSILIGLLLYIRRRTRLRSDPERTDESDQAV